MANWNQPALTDTYANFLAYIDARLDDLAYGLDPAVTTVTNTPTNATRWNSASNRWEKFNGTSWAALSSLYAIAISGNAATATTLATARTINGVAFDGSGNITIQATTPQALTFNNDGTGSTSGTWNGNFARTISYNTIGAPSVTGANATGTWSISITGNAATATTAGACSGNAATVTNGVYTTGTQSIGGLKTFTDDLTVSATVVNVGNGIAGEKRLALQHSTCSVYFYNNTSSVVGLWDVGASQNRWTTDVAGNFTAAGNLTANSDERLKENWRDLPDSFLAELANVKMGVYDRIDNRITQVGVSAQSLQGVLPWAINESADGVLSVAYGNAALAASIALAREVVSLRRELNELKGA